MSIDDQLNRELLQALIITNYQNSKTEQINEYKKLFKKTLNIKEITKINLHFYKSITNEKIALKLSLFNVHNHLTDRLVLTLPQFNLCVHEMKNINKQAETVIKEKTIYGLKDQTGLERILGQINQYLFNKDLHPTIIDKATYIWYSIASYQFFTNGNKRTAMLAALTFLSNNYYTFDIHDDMTLYKISVAIAQKSMSQTELKEYITSHCYLDLDLMKSTLGVLQN